MKVGQLLKELSEYDDNDTIVVAYINEDMLKADFPQIRNMTNDGLDSLTDNLSSDSQDVIDETIEGFIDFWVEE